MKTIARITYTVVGIIWLMAAVTFMDIISHNSGPDHGNYWLPTTEALVECMEQYEAEQSASFSFGCSVSAWLRHTAAAAAKTQLRPGFATPPPLRLKPVKTVPPPPRLKPSFSSTTPRHRG